MTDEFFEHSLWALRARISTSQVIQILASCSEQLEPKRLLVKAWNQKGKQTSTFRFRLVRFLLIAHIKNCFLLEQLQWKSVMANFGGLQFKLKNFQQVVNVVAWWAQSIIFCWNSALAFGFQRTAEHEWFDLLILELLISHKSPINDFIRMSGRHRLLEMFFTECSRSRRKDKNDLWKFKKF